MNVYATTENVMAVVVANDRKQAARLLNRRIDERFRRKRRKRGDAIQPGELVRIPKHQGGAYLLDLE